MHIWPPCHVFAYVSANTHTSWLKKNLTFPNYKFGNGQYAFYHIKLSRFAEKNEVGQKYQNFIRGDPYQLGQRILWPMKNYKVNIFFGGLWSSKLRESFWIWKITPRQFISKKNWNPNPSQTQNTYGGGQICPPPVFRYAQIGRS